MSAAARRSRSYRYQQQRANAAVNSAIARGKLIRRPCEQCGVKKTQAHHNDYRKPLVVRWLCALHHARWHTEYGAAKHDVAVVAPKRRAKAKDRRMVFYVTEAEKIILAKIVKQTRIPMSALMRMPSINC